VEWLGVGKVIGYLYCEEGKVDGVMEEGGMGVLLFVVDGILGLSSDGEGKLSVWNGE
jgi:hypothetical protein